MIDWFGLSADVLWVFGAALALGTLSQAFWQASLKGGRLRDQLGTQPNQSTLLGAGFLFCLGLGIAPRQISLTNALWLLLALAFLTNLILLRRNPQ